MEYLKQYQHGIASAKYSNEQGYNTLDSDLIKEYPQHYTAAFIAGFNAYHFTKDGA